METTKWMTGGVGAFRPRTRTREILILQVVTLVWMLVECGVSLFAAWRAHSPALLAFGADSFIELLSAAVVLLQFAPFVALHPGQATRLAGLLLITLAFVVAFTSLGAMVYGFQPETSPAGIGISIAALVAMPALSWAKRRSARKTNNRALAADAVQSATCAYLAAITLCGLILNAVFRIRWIDPIAALAAIPILAIESRRALRGEPCGCC